MTAIPSPQSAKRSFHLWGEISGISLIIMEVLWISLWYETLAGWKESWQKAGLILLAVTLACYLAARLFNVIQLNHWVRLLLYLPWALTCLLGSLKILVYPHESIGAIQLLTLPLRQFLVDVGNSAGFWHLFIVLILIARSASLARRPVDLWDVLRSFQIGLLMLLFFGVAYALSDTVQSILPVYGFIFFGLVAMITARISTISVLRGGRLPVLSRAWWLSMFAAALLVTGLAILAGLFLSGSIGNILAILLKIILAIFGVLTLLVISPLIPLIDLLVNWLKTKSISFLPVQAFQVLNDVLNQIQETTNESTNKILQWITAAGPWLLGAVLLIILLWGLTELGWLPWKRLLPGENETSNLTPSLALKRLLRVRPRLPHLANPVRLLAAARIRRTYAQLLLLSARLGKPRAAAATPLEFLPTLDQLFPAYQAELACITQAYNQIRYGMLPESEEEVQRVLAAWETIRAEGRRLHAEK